MLWVFWIVIGLPILHILMRNMLTMKQEKVSKIFLPIDELFLKRYVLIPDLIAVAKDYLKDEKAIISELEMIHGEAFYTFLSDDQKVLMDNRISTPIAKLLKFMKGCPGLSDDKEALDNRVTLEELEQKIDALRGSYNLAVSDFNDSVVHFPMNFVASLMDLRPKEKFKLKKD